MKRIRLATLCALTIGSIFSTAMAERLLSFRIGMAWPQELLATASPSGDAEAEYGLIIDKKVAFGIAGNFLWNVQAKDVPDPSGHYQTLSAQSTYMFPIMGFFMVDPMPALIIHPVAHFNIGYNSMIYSYTQKDAAGAQAPLSPYFYGLIVQAGVDGLYNIGERSALFIGMEYRWANTSTTSNTNHEFDKRDMSGIGLSAGFRVIL
jgi:hypothetical protein